MNVVTLDLSADLTADFDRREILRYMGCREATPEVDALVSECISECRGVFSYRVCFAETKVEVNGDKISFEFADVNSRGLAKNLSGCKSAVVFGATVGLGIDRLVSKYGRLSPSRAVALQAIGAERIEALCDSFCERLKCQYGNIRPRFSPGYGDLSLEFQRELFSALKCPRYIGLTLNDSLLMSPTKSVTAVVGIHLF